MTSQEFPAEEYARKLYEFIQFASGVTETIGEIEEKYDVEWHWVGGFRKNHVVAKNQSSHPMHSIAEVIINCPDAILRGFAERMGLDDDEYASMKEAFNDLYDSKDDRPPVRLRAEGETARSSEAGRITLAVEDHGRGQNPDDIGDTFCGALDSDDDGRSKEEFDFVQGQFSAGSFGSLAHCRNGYKMVLTASQENPKEWGWTIIRDSDDPKGGYEYMTVNGSIPSFSGVEMLDGQEHGTGVKMFEYDVGKNVGSADISKKTTFRQKLERYLVDFPLPITLKEDRDYSAKASENTTWGLLASVKERDVIEEHIQKTADVTGIGELPTDILVFKDSDDLTEGRGDDGIRTKKDFVSTGEIPKNHAVLLTVNGQTHASFGQEFLRDCGLYQLDDDCIVIVDFTAVANDRLAEIFKPSRDRIDESSIGDDGDDIDIERDIKEAIRNDKRLEEYNRERSISRDESEASDALEDVVSDVLENGRDLQNVLNSGDLDFIGGGATKKSADGLTLRSVPEHFEVIEKLHYDEPNELWEADEMRQQLLREVITQGADGLGVDLEDMVAKEIPVNASYGEIYFELDAENSYRIGDDRLDIMPRHLEVDTALSNGILTLQVSPPDDAVPNTQVPMLVRVNRDEGDPLWRAFVVEWAEEREPPESPPSGSDPSDGNEASGGGGVGAPDVVGVSEDEWNRIGFDEGSVSTAREEDGEVVVYVNEDSEVFNQFMNDYRFKKSAIDSVQNRLKKAAAVLALGLYLQFSSDDNCDDSEMPLHERIENATRGAGYVFPRLMMSEERLDEVTY